MKNIYTVHTTSDVCSEKAQKEPRNTLKIVNMTCALYSYSHAIAISEKQTEMYDSQENNCILGEVFLLASIA